jgi:hypothetical protein
MTSRLYTTFVLKRLAEQISGIFNSYRRLLDDEFAFHAGTQVPQVATIFDLLHDAPLDFKDAMMTLPEVVGATAYRHGFTGVKRIGHGGYAVVIGDDPRPGGLDLVERTALSRDKRRVIRLVPDHHVPDVLGDPDQPRPFDVRLDGDNEPIRDDDYPLLLSDIFLLPRHTTRLVFQDADGATMQAAGRPAILHCQLLPEVIALNDPELDRRKAEAAGDLLQVVLASLGVHVADAHGGNGGVLVGRKGQPLVLRTYPGDGTIREQYIPVVLDYGYYAEIGPKTLGVILARHGVTAAMVRDLIDRAGAGDGDLRAALDDDERPLADRLMTVIRESGLPRQSFGRLLYHVESTVIEPNLWITQSEQEWQTIKERSNPPLRDRRRLHRIYPSYDEIVFPQRVEEFEATLVSPEREHDH